MKLNPDNIPNLGVDETGTPYLIDQPVSDAVIGTVLCANLFNPIIKELYNAISLSGLTPSTDNTQLYQVIKGITTNITNAQGDIAILQNFKNTVSPQLSTFIVGTPATGGTAGKSVAIDPSGNVVLTDGNGKPYNLITKDDLANALQAFKASTTSPDDLAKLIIQYNNAIASIIQNLVASGKGIGSSGNYDDLAQAIHDGNEEIANTLKNLINQAITVSGGTSNALNQEIADRKAADVNLAQTIHDGNEEITATLKSMVGNALNISQDEITQEIARAKEEEAYIPPAGSLIGWSSTTPPTGWLLCNGQSFSTTQYPNLAAVYPSGSLPNLSGGAINYIVKAA